MAGLLVWFGAHLIVEMLILIQGWRIVSSFRGERMSIWMTRAVFHLLICINAIIVLLSQ